MTLIHIREDKLSKLKGNKNHKGKQILMGLVIIGESFQVIRINYQEEIASKLLISYQCLQYLKEECHNHHIFKCKMNLITLE